MVVIALQVSFVICSNEACNGFRLLAHTQLSLFQNSLGGRVLVTCRPCNVPIVSRALAPSPQVQCELCGRVPLSCD